MLQSCICSIRKSVQPRSASFTMGRRKRQNKRNPLPYKNERNYQQTPKDNALFLKYYSGLGVMPENETQDFYNQMKEPLPVTFRITGSRSQAQELLKIIRNQFFDKLVGSQASEPSTGGADSSVTAPVTAAESGGGGGGGGEQGAKMETAEMKVGGDGDNSATVGLTKETIKPPKCLTWYPGELAWQLDLSRKAVRSQEILSKLHEFLVSETETGNISRQEAVSMIPPLVLDIKSNSKVLDMCAAPGSKTAQLIEYLHKDESSVPEGFVVANDRENKRCYLMVHQVKRLASPCCMIVNHDASFFPQLRCSTEGDKPEVMLFDRVLADVPCSGDGTMRKNIDIWHKWHPAMGNSMHGLQLKILKRGLELLEVGGRLVYSTCSMQPVEDEAVIAEMLRKCQGSVELVDISSYLPDFKTVPGLRTWKLMTKQGQWLDDYDSIPANFKQQYNKSMFPPTPEEAEAFNLHRCHRILPHHQDTGGFFVAALQKVDHLPWSRQAHLKKEAEAAQADATKTVTTTTEAAATAAAETPPAAATATSNGGDVPVSDSRKRKGESQDGPQPKKKELHGYKEDPFLFLQPEDPILPPIKEFYGLTEDFPSNQLLYRSEHGAKRALYFVSKAIRQIVTCNEGRVRFINMGVKFVSRSPSPLVPDCDFRITQECLGSLQQLLTKRRVPITRDDAIIILREENPFVNKLSQMAQDAMEQLKPGCVIFTYKPTESNPEPACEVTFCGWRGKFSVRSFVARFERSHSLRLFGQDMEELRAEVARMKAERQKQQETQQALGDGAEPGDSPQPHTDRADPPPPEADTDRADPSPPQADTDRGDPPPPEADTDRADPSPPQADTAGAELDEDEDVQMEEKEEEEEADTAAKEEESEVNEKPA